MRANNLIGSGNYMTRENKKGIVRLVTDKEQGVSILPPSGYVDLGLPSGTYWKKTNEYGFYSYDQAVSRFGNKLPTKQQFEELKKECKWTETGNGYKVTGPSGDHIVLPAEGYGTCDGDVRYVGTQGYYWSSTRFDSDYMWFLEGFMLRNSDRCYGRSVRLVQ